MFIFYFIFFISFFIEIKNFGADSSKKYFNEKPSLDNDIIPFGRKNRLPFIKNLQ
jgi:hypothetical protein